LLIYVFKTYLFEWAPGLSASSLLKISEQSGSACSSMFIVGRSFVPKIAAIKTPPLRMNWSLYGERERRSRKPPSCASAEGSADPFRSSRKDFWYCRRRTGCFAYL